MAFNYDRTQKTALKLVAKFGKTGELRDYFEGTLDPVEGTVGTSYMKMSPKMVSVPSVSAGFKYFDESFLAGLATGRTKIFLIAALGLEAAPLVGMEVFWGGKLWVVGTEDNNTGVMPLSPLDDKPILYTVGCRVSGRDPSEGTAIDSGNIIQSELFDTTMNVTLLNNFQV